MSQLASTIEVEVPGRATPEEIFRINAARETALSRLLMLYVGSGLFFMLLPGTFLGVWNLIAISSQRAPQSVSAAWLQAHGHAQIFGWIGTFILGIGFYSIPKMRHANFGLWVEGATWSLWTSGVALRWLANVYLWHWRILLPFSATLELGAFLIFLSYRVRPSPAGFPQRKAGRLDLGGDRGNGRFIARPRPQFWNDRSARSQGCVTGGRGGF